MVQVILVPLTTHGVQEFIEGLCTEVKKVLEDAGLRDVNVIPWPEVVKPSTKCFNWSRGQYHANCLVKYVRDQFQVLGVVGRVYIVGVGYLDSYEHGLNFVFGEAQPEYKVAVVFTKRLRPEYYGELQDYNLYFERLVKEVVHELGHLLGLEHCNNYCVMRFSNSIREVDGKPRYYCDDCKVRILRGLGIT